MQKPRGIFGRGGTSHHSGDDSLLDVLARKARSKQRAGEMLRETGLELGLTEPEPSNALAGLALIKLGHDSEVLASALTWSEFEDFCAKILTASGFTVERNIVLTKPRRQIDILAESPSLYLCIDCKHWRGRLMAATLTRFSLDQTERATILKRKRGLAAPVVPVILTMSDTQSRMVEGVPVVPLLALRNFLSSVSAFQEGLCVV